MWKERQQFSTQSHGKTETVEGGIIDAIFARDHGISLNSTGPFRVAAIGYDAEHKVTGVIPVGLTVREAFKATTSEGLKEIFSEAAKQSLSDFGLETKS